MIKNKIREHKIILLILFSIIICSYVANSFISHNTIIEGGEYIFSFDYLGHVDNILKDPRSQLAQDNTNCFDCPDFYHYSRWYSLFKIGYHGLSQALHLHPFIFLILSMIITQLVSLYIFTRVIFNKINWFAFIPASFAFIFYPYKYSLLIETHDGLLYSNMILYMTILFWSLKHVQKITYKKLLIFSSGAGILLSMFFNISLAFLPIALYTTLIIAICFHKNIFNKLKKTFIYFLITISIALFTNVPLINSLLRLGNSRHYEGYISFSSTDSFLSGLEIAKTDPWIVITYVLLFWFFFLYAPMKRQYKIWLLLVYLLISLMIAGSNSPLNIYGWLFENVPLMDALRATYRFMVFELLIFFVFIYLALIRLSELQKIKRLSYVIVSLLLIYLPLQHILNNQNYFFKATLPNEYFEAQEYLNTKSEKKIYFPPRTLLFHNIATDYTWGDPKYNASILLYKNPYTSLLPIKDLVQFERFPYLLSPEYLELNYFTDLKLPPEKIIKALELRGVRYIIVDKNYKWHEIYPDFDPDKLASFAKVEKKFGNITIMHLEDKSSECKKGYGRITIDYCTSFDSDTKLLGKTKEEFILENFPEKIGEKLEIRRNSVYTKSVLDPILHQSLMDNKIYFGRAIMQIAGKQSAIFNSNKLKKGKYIVYLPLFKYTEDMHLMQNAQMIIKAGDREVKRISPYASTPGIYWEKVFIDITDQQKISVDIKNEGYIVVPFKPVIRAIH